MHQVAGRIILVFDAVETGGAQAAAGVGQVIEQVAGRIKVMLPDALFGLPSLGDAAERIVVESPGALVAVIEKQSLLTISQPALFPARRFFP